MIIGMGSRLGGLCREARRRRGLSQRDLARLAGVTQPTIAAIESGRRNPSFDLFDRIVRLGGLPIEVRLVDEDHHSAAAAAREVAARLGDGAREGGAPEDGALRSVIDLRDALVRSPAEELYHLVADRPPLCGEPRWDALIAGVVEEVCCDRRQPPPSWTQEPERFVRPLWYLSTLRAFHEWERETVPAALLRHGVLAAAGELASV
jgi:transcriptional regulator with XRE-family HTH domain